MSFKKRGRELLCVVFCAIFFIVSAAQMVHARPESKVVIQPFECLERGLIPASINLSWDNSSLVVSAKLTARTYLHLSGPPGGPFGWRLDEASFEAPDRNTVETAVRERYGKQLSEPGQADVLRLASIDHPAFSFAVGSSHARAAHCAVVFRAPGHGSDGILLDFWLGPAGEKPLTCSELAAGRPFVGIFESLRIDFP